MPNRSKLGSLGGFVDRGHEWALFEGAPVPIAYVSDKGEFLKVNELLPKTIGYSRIELQERTFQSITHPDDVDIDVAEVESCLRGEQDSYSMAKRYIHRRGHSIHIDLHVRVVKDDDGKFLYFIAWILPLPNHGKFKVEKDKEGQAYVRPVFNFSDFVKDNWKTLIPWMVAAGYFLFRAATAFLKILDKLEIDF